MLRLICTLIFKLSGWKFVNKVPEDVRSFVFIGAPHTSNHDIVPAMALATFMKRNTRFVIKNDWMKFPISLIIRPAGGIGLDRSKLKGSNTDVMAHLFQEYPELALMIAPEGTRKPNPTWKTGFYYIAEKAKVPIALGYGDYAKKEAGVGKLIYPTDFEKDMKEIMDFYRGMQGKNPENFLLDVRYV